MKTIFALLLALVAALAQAQTTDDPPPFRVVFNDTEVSVVLQAIALKTGANIVYSGRNDAKVSLNVTARSTEEALRAVASAAGLLYRRALTSFVVAPADQMKAALQPYGLRQRITLNGIPVADAAKMVEQALPYLTVTPGPMQLLVVGTRDDVTQARELIAEMERDQLAKKVERQVVVIRYLPPKEAAAVLGAMYGDLRIESAGAAATSGCVAIVGPAKSVEGAMRLLTSIDVPSAQSISDRTCEVYKIAYSSAPQLQKFLEKAMPSLQVLPGPENLSPPNPGFNPLSGATIGSTTSSTGTSGYGGGNGSSSSGGGSSVNVEAGTFKEGERAKSLVLIGPEADVRMALGLLKQLDVKPRQVKVQVRVVDTSPEKAQEFGVKWDWSQFNFWEAPSGTVINEEYANATRPLGVGQVTRLPWDFRAEISAMVTRKQAKLLACPSVTVVDGDDASIFIGDTICTKIAQASGLGTQTVQIAEFPVGIILLLRPRVNADGNISLRLHPAVSTITGISAENLPQTSTREAETTVVVKDGDTVVIGGLIRDEMTKTVREVPLLAQLPLVGELFRHTNSSSKKSEILVFITTQLVGDEPAKPTKEANR